MPQVQSEPVAIPSGTPVVLTDSESSNTSVTSRLGRIPHPNFSSLLPEYPASNNSQNNTININLPGFDEKQPTAFDSIPNYSPTTTSPLGQMPGQTGNSATQSSVGNAAGDFSLKADQIRKLQTDGFLAGTSGTAHWLFDSQNIREAITVLGTQGFQTRVNNETVYIIEGDCRVKQGRNRLEASRAVIWETIIPTASANNTVRQLTIYLESDTQEAPPIIEINDSSTGGITGNRNWVGSLTTSADISIMISTPVAAPAQLPDIYHRANLAKRPTAISTRTFQRTSESSSILRGMPTYGSSNTGVLGFSYETDNVQLLHFPEINQSKIIIEQGGNIVISGLRQNEFMASDTIDISFERAVCWTAHMPDLVERAQAGETIDVSSLDLELYLEGNIIFREGERVIYANRMYYDVNNSVGTILNAEILTPVEQYDGNIRIKSDLIRRTGPGSFVANNSILTTSMMGDPGFYIGSRNIQFEEKRNIAYNSVNGMPIIDPATNRPYEDRRQYVVAEHNVINMSGVPVFYWPWLAFNAKEPVMYLRRAEYYHDDVFGHQARTRWNLYQMLNIRNYPDGTVLDLNLDYLSKRGLGHGIQFTYNRDSVFGAATPAVGLADFWGIYDDGNDNLGLGRRNVEPEKNYRYRAFWQHRQFLNNEPFGKLLGNNWLLTAELGISSDRNFMPQFFEKEWETFKDETTALELKRMQGLNRAPGVQSFALRAEYTVEDFYNRRGSLPRLDHFTVGYSPFSRYFGDYFTWYEHTHIGLRNFETLSSPTNANDLAMFHYLPWEVAPGSSLDPTGLVDPLDSTREVFSTRHEIDMPFNLGPIKCTPYLMGEFAHWGEDRSGDSVDRLMGGAGFRANLPFWKVNPNYSSRSLYINGLAHKANLGFDLSYTTVNENYDRLILHDKIDDRSIEDYRRRYSVTTFNGAVPLLYDERYYAIRSGLGNLITSPSTELADDLTLCRFHFNQTWQTKRGPTNRRRIVDWVTLDTGLNFYPKEEQNFGESIGLIDYNFRWYVGDRFTVLSSGLFDTFNSGQSIMRLGGMLNRPDRGSIYLGVDRLDGPFQRTYLNGNFSYNLSEKWSADYSTSYDLDEGRNMGQSLSLSRKGEVFLVKVGANYDWSRDVWGISFSLEPAFLSRFRSGKSL